MRSRSTSDKRSEDEQGTNEPWEVHLELRTEKRDEDRMGLPTQRQKFARIFLQLALWDQGWGRGGAEKSQPSRATKTREGGDKKELRSHNPLEPQKLERGETKRSYKDIQQRNDVRHGVSTVHLLHTPTEGPERPEVINKRPERLPKDQSVKKLSTKARAPTEGPERQEVINKRPERRPKDQSVKKLSTKGQSAYRRIRASRSYQQRPECRTRTNNKNDRHDGNHTRIGCSYAMAVPMNISSHREVGNLAEEKEKGE